MIRAAVIVAAVLLITGPAFAACSGPAGEESIILYNNDHKTMQFCDGTTWWTMKGGGLWFKSGSEIYYNSGNAGIGKTTPGTALEVGGGITVTPATTVNLTADNQTVTVGNNTYIRLSSNDNDTYANRTFCLTAGLAPGQILVLELVAGKAQLQDNTTGSCGGSPVASNLSGTLSLMANATVTLLYNGTNWVQLATSNNF